MDNIRSLLAEQLQKYQQGAENNKFIGAIQGGLRRLGSPSQQALAEQEKISDLSRKARIGMEQLQQAGQPTQLSENSELDLARKARMGMEAMQGFTMPQAQAQEQPPVVQEPIPERILDVGKHQGLSKTEIPLPEQSIQDLIWEFSPNEATQAAVALAGENPKSDLMARNPNKDGTVDLGLMQTNDKTLRDLLRVYGDQMNQMGIYNPEDVLGDARKSVFANSMARKYEDAPRWWGDTEGESNPWERWYGWQNNGYNMFPEMPIEEVASNPAYFKLREFLDRNPQ